MFYVYWILGTIGIFVLPILTFIVLVSIGDALEERFKSLSWTVKDRLGQAFDYFILLLGIAVIVYLGYLFAIYMTGGAV